LLFVFYAPPAQKKANNLWARCLFYAAGTASSLPAGNTMGGLDAERAAQRFCFALTALYMLPCPNPGLAPCLWGEAASEASGSAISRFQRCATLYELRVWSGVKPLHSKGFSLRHQLRLTYRRY
jgi:hypothetical protein